MVFDVDDVESVGTLYIVEATFGGFAEVAELASCVIVVALDIVVAVTYRVVRISLPGVGVETVAPFGVV